MLTALELCAGGGGQALGFEKAGFEHAALIDNDPHSCATLRMNRPYWNVLEADVHGIPAEYWRGVDVVAAGLPCPPFSVAGQQLGADDERDLFPTLLHLVRKTEPRAVVVENVRGLMMPRFEAYRRQVRRAFETMGYQVHWDMLNAYDYGVSQRRARSFLIALPRGTPFKWPEPNGVASTVGQELRELMSEAGWQLADQWAEKANQPAPTLVGGSRKHGGPDLGPTRARAAWAKLGVDGLGIANDPPPPGFNGMPKLTDRMIARLQSFPTNWNFAGGKTHRCRQIGNALPVRLASAVAETLAQSLR